MEKTGSYIARLIVLAFLGGIMNVPRHAYGSLTTVCEDLFAKYTDQQLVAITKISSVDVEQIRPLFKSDRIDDVAKKNLALLLDELVGFADNPPKEYETIQKFAKTLEKCRGTLLEIVKSHNQGASGVGIGKKVAETLVSIGVEPIKNSQWKVLAPGSTIPANNPISAEFIADLDTMRIGFQDGTLISFPDLHLKAVLDKDPSRRNIVASWHSLTEMRFLSIIRSNQLAELSMENLITVARIHAMREDYLYGMTKAPDFMKDALLENSHFRKMNEASAEKFAAAHAKLVEKIKDSPELIDVANLIGSIF